MNTIKCGWTYDYLAAVLIEIIIRIAGGLVVLARLPVHHLAVDDGHAIVVVVVVRVADALLQQGRLGHIDPLLLDAQHSGYRRSLCAGVLALAPSID